MKAQLAQLYHHIRGQKTFVQHYASVHYLTCAGCLRHHGEISLPSAERPPWHTGCRCHLLEFPLEQLQYYRQQGARMREKATQELSRRRLFRQACRQLLRHPLEAEERFRQAIDSEIYLEEIEVLCREQAEALRHHSQTARRLRDLFVGAYRYKHDLDKYHFVPEGLCVEWRQEGLSRIKECFGAVLTG